MGQGPRRHGGGAGVLVELVVEHAGLAEDVAAHLALTLPPLSLGSLGDLAEAAPV